MKLWIYVARRLALTIPVLLGVTIITFYLSYGMGDPLAAYVTERTTDEQYEMLAEKHGINEPIYVQYFTYLKSIITFDWGYSEVLNEDVSDAFSYRPLEHSDAHGQNTAKILGIEANPEGLYR